MPSKWNEKLVTNFLKQYKQYPCLWNPYHKDYYNCQEKNEALQRIIDGLDKPGFTINDYLHQIKIIREKYKKEQTRIIKEMQSQKHYKSSFPWYNIVADMLTKVISDEEKANSETTISSEHRDTSIVKSFSSDNVWNSQRKDTKSLKISPCTDDTCDKASRRSKSAEKSIRSSIKRNAIKLDKTAKTQSKAWVTRAPNLQVRTNESVSRDLEEDVVSNYKPTRDTESEMEGYSTCIPFMPVDIPFNELNRESNGKDRVGFLQCPSCGWEDTKYKQTESNAEKLLQKQIHFVPCLDYNTDLSRSKYTTCAKCDKDYPKKPTDNSGDHGISQDMRTQMPCSVARKFIGVHRSVVEAVVPSKEDATTEVQYDKVIEIPKDDSSVDSPVQMQIIQLNPEVAGKLQGSTIEACTRLKIILTDSKGASKANEFSLQCAPQNTQSVQCNKPEYSTKETQISPSNILPENKKEISVNTINFVERGVGNTVCISEGPKHCAFSQTMNKNHKSEKYKDKNTGIDFTCLVESKEVEVNIVDQESKGIQSMAYVSNGNSACCLAVENMKDTGTSPSIHEVRNICVPSENFKSDGMNFVFCTAQSQASTKDYICQKDSKDTAEKGIQEYGYPCQIDTCPRNLLQIVKEDPSVAVMLQQLLTKIVSHKSERGTQNTKSSKTSNSQTDYEYKCNATENCSFDVQKLVSEIKKYAIKTLESNRSFSKDEVKELSGKIDESTMSQSVEGKHASTETKCYDTSTDRFNINRENSFKPISESTSPEKDKTVKIFEDETTVSQKAKKFPLVDKQVSTCSECRDIGTSGSLLHLCVRDVGTSHTTYEKSKQNNISVGTQKRDPILVRVIKLNEGLTVVKSDKGTLTVGATTDLEKRYIDKRIETCGRSTCMAYTTGKQTKEERLEYALQKEHENQVDRLKPFKNFTCDKNCKDGAYCERDWTDVTNIDPFRNFNHSKIPVCARPHKCTYATNN